MLTEFELIGRYFSRPSPSAVLGVGDDCALLRPTPGMMLAVTTDMLLEGTHFLAGADPRKLGHKALAVNLSDVAAMGADPRWALLSLALPAADESWLEGFSNGLYALAYRYGVDLVGGDTTRGPLAISITLIGEVPVDLALRRDGARDGDDIWLSGATGEAALAVAHHAGRVALGGALLESCTARLDLPEPRVDLGGRLRGIARSAIDVSDGLLADLGHILERSQVGAEVWSDALPRAAAVAACPDPALAEQCMYGGGDDYELVFTASPHRRDDIAGISAELGIALTRIGVIVPGEARAVLRDRQGNPVSVARAGFDHFR